MLTSLCTCFKAILYVRLFPKVFLQIKAQFRQYFKTESYLGSFDFFFFFFFLATGKHSTCQHEHAVHKTDLSTRTHSTLQ